MAHVRRREREAFLLDFQAGSAHKEEGRLPGRKLVSAHNWRRRQNRKPTAK